MPRPRSPMQEGPTSEIAIRPLLRSNLHQLFAGANVGQAMTTRPSRQMFHVKHLDKRPIPRSGNGKGGARNQPIGAEIQILQKSWNPQGL